MDSPPTYKVYFQYEVKEKDMHQFQRTFELGYCQKCTGSLGMNNVLSFMEQLKNVCNQHYQRYIQSEKMANLQKTFESMRQESSQNSQNTNQKEIRNLLLRNMPLNHNNNTPKSIILSSHTNIRPYSGPGQSNSNSMKHPKQKILITNKNVFVKEEKVFSFVKVAQKRIYESVNEQDNQEVVEEELNQILDKISKSGYDSLSKYEKRRLFKASQKNE
jgi:hypothetical protein